MTSVHVHKREDETLELVRTKAAAGREGLASDEEDKWCHVRVDGEVDVPMTLQLRDGTHDVKREPVKLLVRSKRTKHQ